MDTVSLHVKLDKDLLDRLDKHCTRTGLRRSEVVRAAITDKLPQSVLCPNCGCKYAAPGTPCLNDPEQR